MKTKYCPKRSTNSIAIMRSVMRSVMGHLYYCYEPHYRDGSSSKILVLYLNYSVGPNHTKSQTLFHKRAHRRSFLEELWFKYIRCENAIIHLVQAINYSTQLGQSLFEVIYSCVHISLDKVFFKILRKPSIVQK